MCPGKPRSLGLQVPMDNYDCLASGVAFFCFCSNDICSSVFWFKVVGLLFGIEFTELETEVALQIELSSLLLCPFRADVLMAVSTVAMIIIRWNVTETTKWTNEREVGR